MAVADSVVAEAGLVVVVVTGFLEAEVTAAATVDGAAAVFLLTREMKKGG